MNIIDKYFDFKKRNLINYGSLLLDPNTNNKYLSDFMDTYIATYYYHSLEAYYDKAVINYGHSVVVKEMQAKKIELLTYSKEEEHQHISNCYRISFIAIIIDSINFTDVTKIADFKDILRKILITKSKFKIITEDILDKLSNMVKDNVLKERKFFNNMVSDNFNIAYYKYASSTNYYKVDLNYHLEQLENQYRFVILDKNFHSDEVSINRLNVLMNLFSMDLIDLILEKNDLSTYFIEIPMTNIKKRSELEELVGRFSNPVVKSHIVYVIKYSDYNQKKTMFKNLGDYNFALLVDFSKAMSVEKRMEDIEKMNLFRYVLVSGVKKNDTQFVASYEIPGKEKFSNEVVEV